MRAFLTAAVIVLALPGPLLAGQFGKKPGPYANLFGGQFSAPRLQPAPTPAPAVPFFTVPPEFRGQNQAVVRCGMTVVQGDSKIDPSMAQKPPANAPKGTVKVGPPAICGR